jgi:uncharacterized phage-associated protein
MYDARQIANWFVLRAQKDARELSIMQLLKLVYIAHGWHLETQGGPLVSNKIQAWQYGPVIPDVYNSFRRQGVIASSTTHDVLPVVLDPSDEALLEEVWDIYGHLPAFRLSDLTHVPGGPWDIATKTGGNYANIPNELILQHYQALRRQASELT